MALVLAALVGRAFPEVNQPAGEGGLALAPYDISCWTTDNGLPQNSVNDLLQTPDGYLWIATYNGLARFDGVRFAVFDKGNTPAFAHNAINALLLDGVGDVWIGTSGGLARRRPGREPEFEPIAGLHGRTVLTLADAGGDGVWIGTTHGLVRLHRDGRTELYGEAAGLPAAPISCLCDAGAEGLWVGSIGGGAGRLRQGKYHPFTTRQGLPDDNIHALLRDPDGTVWICTEKGLVSVGKGGFRVFGRDAGFSDEDMRTVFRDGRGRLWVGTNKGGVNSQENGRFVPFPLHPFVSNDSPRAFLEDREGSLWIGFKGGLAQLKPGKFLTYDRRRGLPADEVRAVLPDRAGNVWIGTVGAGLVRFDGTGFTRFGRPEGLLNERVWSLALAPDGSVWAGTYGGGVVRFHDGVFECFDRSRGLSSDSVRVVFVDSRGWVWVGTNGGGVNVIRDGRVDQYGTLEGLAGNIVYAIAEGPPGHVWVGAFSGGLSCIRDGQVVSFGKEAGLQEHAVWALHPEPNGDLWFGTNDHGLGLLRAGRCRYFTTREGLAEDIAFQVLEDGVGRLWLNGNAGIYAVHKADLEACSQGRLARVPCRTLGKADGYPNLSCDGPGQPSASAGADGRFWFSTVRGVVALDPLRTPVNPVAPPLVIEKVVLNGISFPTAGPLDASPGDGNLEVGYTAASFINPERIQFQFRLEGFDRAWVQAGSRRAAYYTNLPPGEYTLHVIACNGDGLWNRDGIRLHFRIRPFFHQTTIFYVGLGALLIGGVWTVHRLRLRHVKIRARQLQSQVDARTRELREAQEALAVQNEKLREVDRLKTDFLAAVSHELRTPITSIYGFAKVTRKHFRRLAAALDGLGLDPGVRAQVPKVEANLEIIMAEGERLTRLVNEGLDLAKIESGNMQWADRDLEAVVLVRRAVRGVEGYFLANEALVWTVDLGDLDFWLRVDEDRILQVISNLVSNAVKYTARGAVRLAARRDGEWLRVSVEDNGRGIPEADRARVFDKFYQAAQPRVADGGTGLGLPICREIVEHYGGSIWVENRPGPGSTFVFTLPVLPDKSRPPLPAGEP